MTTWVIERTTWWLSRLAATLAFCFTIQRMIAAEGYRCELWSIIVAAAMIIVSVKLWIPKCDCESHR